MNQHTKDLQAQLTRFKELNHFTLEETGAKFGYSSTAICKYLKGEFNGNLEKLEKAIEDGLRVSEQRQRANDGLFDSHPCVLVRRVANRVRNRHSMEMLFGDAGVGKTCGTDKYLLTDLSAWFVTMVIYKRNQGQLIQVLWKVMGNGAKGLGRGGSRMEAIEDMCRGTNRLLIIDQAHLLNKNGRQFFCDLHDRTGLPIIFIGNPIMFEDWQEIEQQFSRIAEYTEATLRPNVIEQANGHSPERAAMDLVAKYAPADAHESLRERGVDVARGKGHLRSLKMTLESAVGIVQATGCTWLQAFDAADRQQVRNYKG